MSCGASPTDENGKKRLRAPILEGPSITTCEISSQPSPSSTPAPTVQYGPILHDESIFAAGSRMAVGWTFISGASGLLLLWRWVVVSIGCGACPSVTVHEPTGDDCLGNSLVFDENRALHAHGIAAPGLHVHFDSQLVSGNDWPTEACFLNPRKNHELAFAIRDFGQQERPAGLRDGFDDQHTWHDGKIRKVAGKKWLVDGDVLDGYDALHAHQIDHAVDQQKRVAMRQDAHDFMNVELGVLGCRRFGRDWGGVAHSGFIRRDDYTLSHAPDGIAGPSPN